MDDKDIDKHVERYKLARPHYEQLTKRTEDLLKALLQAGNIKYHAIEPRTKEIDSFKDKLSRKEKNYLDPLKEITDFSGLRIITYYQDDVEKIIRIIEKEFEVDKENSVDKSKLMNPNEFGYLSVHFVVNPSKGRSGWTEWNHLRDHKCEIQIRTVLQHAWASISHALQYKQKEDVPTKLQRKLFRLAGLFELADEQFLEIRDNHETEKEEVNHIQDIETSDSEINILTVEKFILESNIVNKLFEKALINGFTTQDPYSGTDSYSNIVSMLKDLNVSSVKEFNQLLFQIERNLNGNYYSALVKEVGGKWITDKSFIILLTLIPSNTNKFQKPSLIERHGFPDWLAETVIKVIRRL